MIKVTPILTADGSSTLYSEKHRAYYHSLNGAVQESKHIFIDAGFYYHSKRKLSILEIGFGTGLNASLTASAAYQNNISTDYMSIELYPLTDDQLILLNYDKILDIATAELWNRICEAPWDSKYKIHDFFSLTKRNVDFLVFDIPKSLDIVYFDAFAPDDQREMWDEEIFRNIFQSLNAGGILVTYCSKGIVKRALRDSGFKIERLPGPPGKRHMIRAIKIS